MLEIRGSIPEPFVEPAGDGSQLHGNARRSRLDSLQLGEPKYASGDRYRLNRAGTRIASRGIANLGEFPDDPRDTRRLLLGCGEGAVDKYAAVETFNAIL
ncbi:hypothetical protein LBMAG47_21890 [Planctomycetia bacterium]|jgi:hypothetical protein|nr:hypothetical protein LBMAG47_21890 [Planctomycetia bacterium]